jgi:hypothetical protein
MGTGGLTAQVCHGSNPVINGIMIGSVWAIHDFTNGGLVSYTYPTFVCDIPTFC